MERTILAHIAREMDGLSGHLGFYYKNLETGLEFGVRDEEAFLAASLIKLPLLLHVLTEHARGKLDLTEKITVTEADKLPSCGALRLFPGTMDVDILTLCRLMISLSDNTATNLLIRRCGIRQVNEGFQAMGLKQTVLRRLLFDAGAAAAGLENTVSPREMGCLLEQLYRNRFVSPQVSQLALELLKQQQINHKLDGKLCGKIPMAHKTGEDTNLSNDAGILYATQPVILCFTGHDTDKYPWEDLMRRAAYALIEAQSH